MTVRGASRFVSGRRQGNDPRLAGALAPWRVSFPPTIALPAKAAGAGGLATGRAVCVGPQQAGGCAEEEEMCRRGSKLHEIVPPTICIARCIGVERLRLEYSHRMRVLSNNDLSGAGRGRCLCAATRTRTAPRERCVHASVLRSLVLWMAGHFVVKSVRYRAGRVA